MGPVNGLTMDGTDPFDFFPEEICLSVLSLNKEFENNACALVNKKWHRLVSNHVHQHLHSIITEFFTLMKDESTYSKQDLAIFQKAIQNEVNSLNRAEIKDFFKMLSFKYIFQFPVYASKIRYSFDILSMPSYVHIGQSFVDRDSLYNFFKKEIYYNMHHQEYPTNNLNNLLQLCQILLRLNLIDEMFTVVERFNRSCSDDFTSFSKKFCQILVRHPKAINSLLNFIDQNYHFHKQIMLKDLFNTLKTDQQWKKMSQVATKFVALEIRENMLLGFSRSLILIAFSISIVASGAFLLDFLGFPTVPAAPEDRSLEYLTFSVIVIGTGLGTLFGTASGIKNLFTNSLPIN